MQHLEPLNDIYIYQILLYIALTFIFLFIIITSACETQLSVILHNILQKSIEAQQRLYGSNTNISIKANLLKLLYPISPIF